MQKILFALRTNLTFEKFPYLTILSNVFLGFALGRILILSGDEMAGNVWIKIFLIIGTCLFSNYLLCVRKAASGITRTISGKLRPFLKEAVLCAVLNGCILFLSISLFFFKTL